jgi:hypothetical protein
MALNCVWARSSRTPLARGGVQHRLRLALEVRNDLGGKQFRGTLGRRGVGPFVAHLQHPAEPAGRSAAAAMKYRSAAWPWHESIQISTKSY